MKPQNGKTLEGARDQKMDRGSNFILGNQGNSY